MNRLVYLLAAATISYAQGPDNQARSYHLFFVTRPFSTPRWQSSNDKVQAAVSPLSAAWLPRLV